MNIKSPKFLNGTEKTKISSLMKDLFVNRSDCFSVQTMKGYRHQNKDLTKETIQQHLNGELTLGVYQLNSKNEVKWVCFDFDGTDLEIEKQKAIQLAKKLNLAGHMPLIEFSGKKGYHVWVFCEPADAYNAKKFAEGILKEVDFHD